MNITSFRVTDDKSALILQVEDAADASTLHLWTKETYKVDEFKVDLTNKLTGQYSQNIIITLEDLAISEFDGVYFVDIASVADNACKIVGELTRYKECLIEKRLKYRDCDSCLEINYPEVLNTFSLLYTLEKAIELNLTQEVLTTIFALDKFCSNDCKGCGEYKNI